ncbi:MAG TPA: M28 family peptidase [Salinimicrobium sp.]|nr:M28 family peptidase [Salinimicrobium sp.]
MKKSIVKFCFLIALMMGMGCGTNGPTVSEVETKNSPGPEEITISEDEVAHTLKYLSSDELKGRMTGTEGIEKAAEYIENVFRKNNIQPYFETYRDSFKIEGITGYNIVGFKEGTDPGLKDQFIIIGAHYDHIGVRELVNGDSIANGANDNASGTTAVLELAKYLSDIKTKRSILFTLYSAEEMGLVGSSLLARRLKEKGIKPYVMFNIEMVGVPMVGKDYAAYLTGYNLSNLAEKFNAYSGEKVLGFLPRAKKLQLFRRSDNYPFYEQFHIPAQTISTFDFTNFEYYHHVDDEFSEMNVAHLTGLIEEIIPGIVKMANTPTMEIKLTNP